MLLAPQRPQVSCGYRTRYFGELKFRQTTCPPQRDRFRTFPSAISPAFTQVRRLLWTRISHGRFRESTLVRKRSSSFEGDQNVVRDSTYRNLATARKAETR